MWEAVHYRDAGMTGFARFDPAYPCAGPRPTFCVWEIGIVAAEAATWSSYLQSPRAADDDSNWQRALFSGPV